MSLLDNFLNSKNNMKMKNIFYLVLIFIIGCVPANKSLDSNFDPESKLKELGIELIIPSDPVANYVNTVRSGNLLFISGKGPLKNDGEYIKGKLGYDLSIDEGYEAARATAINLISTIKSAVGDLKNVNTSEFTKAANSWHNTTIKFHYQYLAEWYQHHSHI